MPVSCWPSPSTITVTSSDVDTCRRLKMPRHETVRAPRTDAAMAAMSPATAAAPGSSPPSLRRRGKHGVVSAVPPVAPPIHARARAASSSRPSSEPARRLGHAREQQHVDQRHRRRDRHRDAPPRVRRVDPHVDHPVDGVAQQDADVDRNVGDGDERTAVRGRRDLGDVHAARAPAAAGAEALQRRPSSSTGKFCARPDRGADERQHRCGEQRRRRPSRSSRLPSRGARRRRRRS